MQLFISFLTSITIVFINSILFIHTYIHTFMQKKVREIVIVESLL